MLKGLRELKELQKHHYGTLDEFDRKLSIIEKELKALEIIKKFAKSITLQYIFCDDLVILIVGGDEFEWQYKCSSQEEWDLLKEILC